MNIQTKMNPVPFKKNLQIIILQKVTRLYHNCVITYWIWHCKYLYHRHVHLLTRILHRNAHCNISGHPPLIANTSTDDMPIITYQDTALQTPLSMTCPIILTRIPHCKHLYRWHAHYNLPGYRIASTSIDDMPIVTYRDTALQALLLMTCPL